MKRFAILALLIFLSSVLHSSYSIALEIKGSKHDLSMPGPEGTGPGPIQSTGAGTAQICVFCHTPHSARPDAPLWNRSISQESYIVYTSDVLQALGMAADNPADTGAADYAIHTKTRICLSCHDGTIALGNLANLPYGLSTNVPMLGTDAGKIPTAAASNIGIDLSDDHPVAIKHDSTKDPELILPAAPPAGRVRLYGYDINGRVAASAAPQNGDYVECTSCHDAHDNGNGNFLVDANTGSKICISCHQKETGSGGAGSLAHQNATGAPYNPDAPAGTIGTTVAEVQCMNCHYPHRSGATGASYPFSAYTNESGGQYLLSFEEENTCFNSLNRWNNSTTACHGSGSAKDIESLVGKSYGHKSSLNPGKHRATEQGKDDFSKYGLLAGASWHVQCNDCHNPHTAGSVSHVSPMVGGPVAISASSPLYGAGGVKIPAASNPPLASEFTAFEALGVTTTSAMHADYYEYQICYKCHSSFAWGANPAPNSPSLGAAMTDQAAEFRMGIGRSFHPVQGVTGRNRGKMRTDIVDWQTNIGNQTMYCSDCHAQEGYASPGPHGSANPFILGNTFQDQYGTRGTGAAGKQTADLCFDCHDQSEYLPTIDGQLAAGTGFYAQGSNVNLHTQHAFRAVTPINPVNPYPYRCVNCHTRIPHGNDRKAMIVLSTDAAQYRPGAGMISVFSAQAAGYVIGNCTTVAGCHIP